VHIKKKCQALYKYTFNILNIEIEKLLSKNILFLNTHTHITNFCMPICHAQILNLNNKILLLISNLEILNLRPLYFLIYLYISKNLIYLCYIQYILYYKCVYKFKRDFIKLIYIYSFNYNRNKYHIRKNIYDKNCTLQYFLPFLQ